MGHSYEKSKKIATKTILLLAAVTVIEVVIALLGKGYLIKGFHLPLFLMGGLMIILSAFKAYVIVYEFMHMKYEVPGLRKTVLLPTLLLTWALIAFLYEGGYWKTSRADGVSVGQIEEVTSDHSKTEHHADEKVMDAKEEYSHEHGHDDGNHEHGHDESGDHHEDGHDH